MLCAAKRWILTSDRAEPGQPLRTRVLEARGIVDAVAIERFCTPRLSDLHSPSMLSGADAAARRIVDAVLAGKCIAIYGDYDVDGICAAAILFHLLRMVAPGAQIRTYVPHRIEEGYGLNTDALLGLKRDGVDLVVSVDCGITAAEPVRAARAAGLDVIITDHHHLPQAPQALPDALLVHPALPSANGEGSYPFPDLCGAGVAYKLAWRLATIFAGSDRLPDALRRLLMDLLPLAAMATIADVVPLVGENRVLTHFGLMMMRQTPLVGLRALLDASGYRVGKVETEGVGFQIGPRLNACGRMGHAADAVRLLTDAPPAEAAEIAQRLTTLNGERQRVEKRIAEHATQMVRSAGLDGPEPGIIVLADPDWHPGVVGIVCARLTETFGRPSILLQEQGEICKGSARSVEGFSIHEAIGHAVAALHAEGIDASFGGHAAAAGVRIPTHALAQFTASINEYARANLDPVLMTPALAVDCAAQIEEFTLAAVKELTALAPFGRGNRAPALLLRGVELAQRPRAMGATGAHASLMLRGRTKAPILRATLWKRAKDVADLAPGANLDLVVEPRISTFRAEAAVELDIKDLRLSAAPPFPEIRILGSSNSPVLEHNEVET